ncbi:hypothetical protein ACOME3_002214 [Neoechinorhynchus agilis]
MESVMLCMDTSEYMRDGDLTPNRLLCQLDSAYSICQAILRQHVENQCGILDLADCRVKAHLTNNTSVLQGKIYSLRPWMEPTDDVLNRLIPPFKKTDNGPRDPGLKGIDIVKGIRTANLALIDNESSIIAHSLWHRSNPELQKARIIVFIGSPIYNTDRTALKDLCSRFRKMQVSVDIISFGPVEKNHEVLEEFVNGVTSGNVTLYEKTDDTDRLAELTRQVINGINPSSAMVDLAPGAERTEDLEEMDPELAMALRISAEEHQRAQLQQQQQQQEQQQQTVTTNEPVAVQAQQNAQQPDLMNMTEEEQLEWALKLSMQDTAGMDGPCPMDVDEPEPGDEKKEEEKGDK